jgi:CheY-like chemotaxis protein/two-component sensor histidine kinase
MGHLLMKDNPRPEQINHLKILRTASDNLLLLINDILDFSKIEAGKIELEELDFNLKHLVSEIKLANSVGAQERGNQIKLMIDSDMPAIVKGDSLRIGQILTNLVSNAIKFTKDGLINIEVMLKKMKGNEATVYFAVSDTGVGISKDNFDKIFSKFTQESSSITRQFGGTGLGLSITVKLLKLMHSEIKLESKLGKGSKFSFVLNFMVNHNAIEETYDSPGNNFDLQQVKILLVEDTPFNVLYATQLIESWNATVDIAENGFIAVEKMKVNDYHLVLMDLQMPVMDGYTAAKSIREFNSHVPIIALTASATSNIKEKTFAAGMNDYVTKPFNPDDFYQRIRKYTH